MTGERAHRKPPWPVWLVVALAFIVLAGGVGYRLILPLVMFGSPKIVVRNDSTKTLSNLEVSLNYSGGPSKVKRVDMLRPNGACSMRAQAEVTQVRVRFLLDGQMHVHEELTDLWRGETYSLHIEADGSVRSGYD